MALDDSIISLYKIIKRNYKLAIKENIGDFYPRFHETFELLCQMISSLANSVSIDEFKKIIIPPKEIPLIFLEHKDKLAEFSKIIQELHNLQFNSYEIIDMIQILLEFLKDDQNNVKLHAFMNLLERLFII